MLKYLINEKKIMEELKHPNIIRFDNFFESKTHYFFIMEYCNGESLSNLLKKYKEKYRKPFTLEIIQCYMSQLIEGLKYIHSKNIIHRDLKLDNILVQFKTISRNTKDKTNFNELNDNDFLNATIKIIDFGFSTKLEPGILAKTIVGSPAYMDPYILSNCKNAKGNQLLEGYNEKADIWSLGAICFQMLTGDPLFAVYDFKELFEKVKEGNYSIPIDIEISDEIISFLNSMLQYDGNLRPSCEKLLKHDFLKKNVQDFIKIDYRKNPESQDISYIIINAMRNSIYVNNHQKLKNSKEIYLNYIDRLLNDYKAVKLYFKENGLFDREKDA